jgi:uncharacterized membrane protein
MELLHNKVDRTKLKRNSLKHTLLSGLFFLCPVHIIIILMEYRFIFMCQLALCIETLDTQNHCKRT